MRMEGSRSLVIGGGGEGIGRGITRAFAAAAMGGLDVLVTVVGGLRVFLEQGTGGTIVSVGSVTGFMAAPEQGGYGAAKAGLLSLARTVAMEYAGDGIQMNVVAAGAISTAVAASSQTPDEIAQIPLGRFGTVADGGVSVRGPFG